MENLESALQSALEALLSQQNPNGSWDYDMEEGVNLVAYYILYRHFIGENIDEERRVKFGRYIKCRQLVSGGWVQYPNGPFNLNLSVLVYLALKTLGDSEDDQHMRSAAKAIRNDGGVEACITLTRIQLVIYEILSKESIPSIPVEFLLLPTWFPFNVFNVAYFFRVVLTPMLVLLTIPRSSNHTPFPKVDELFVKNPYDIKPVPRAKGQSLTGFIFFKALDRFSRVIKPFIPKYFHQRALEKAIRFVSERTYQKMGFAGILFTMTYADMMFEVLKYRKDHRLRVINRQSIEKLVVDVGFEAYFVAVKTPVWDTALATHALLETKDARALQAAKRGIEYLIPLQILKVRGDWSLNRPNLRPGGWSFFPGVLHYPDTDDTTVIILAMQKLLKIQKSNLYLDLKYSIKRGMEWITGMQCKNGAWVAFEADCTSKNWDNSPIVFANHEDQTTVTEKHSIDITCRCMTMLIAAGETPDSSKAVRNALKYILENQREDGSWLGQWGVAYIFGTWCVLTSLIHAKITKDHPSIQRGIQWLLSIQNSDGGWGETPESYRTAYTGHVKTKSTATQTAWSVLGLMAAGEFASPAVEAGIAYLLKNQQSSGQWDEAEYFGVVLKNVSYTKYHGYSKYYPMMALARYRNFKREEFRHGTAFVI